MTKVSIIVPVYNVEKYLEKCLDSLVNQTLKDIEIIVVNDGTKDNSQKIIDKYVKKYENVHGYKKKNGGLSSARNYGLKYATGEYIAFVDSDDYVDLDMYESMYNKAKSCDYDVVVCDTINVYENYESYRVSNLKYSSDNNKNYIIAPPMACIRLYKKDLFNKVKFKEGIYYEDLNLTPGLIKYTSKIGFIDSGYYHYLQRSNSIMKQLDFNEKLLDIFSVLENNYNVLIDDYPDEVEYLYITHLLRTSTLRFLNYNYEEIKRYLLKINVEIKNKFPNWRKNVYYKKSSIKLKLICILAFNEQYKLLKFIKKITKA